MTIVKTELELERALSALADAERRADDAEEALAEFLESSAGSFGHERERLRLERDAHTENARIHALRASECERESACDSPGSGSRLSTRPFMRSAGA